MQSGLLGLLGCCTAVWTLVYAALRRSAAARRLLSSPVPSSIFERRQDGSSPPAWLSLDWVIVSGGIGWLGFDTPRYNELPSRLVGTGLSSAGAAKSFDDPPSRMRWHRRLVRSAMDVGYGIGAVVVVLGVGVAFVVLLKAVVQSLGALRGLVMRDGGKAALAGSGQAMRMVKRAVVPILSEKAPLATTASSNLMLRPMIPGVTMPLSQLPQLLAAIVISQSFHELGHGVAAALDNLPLLSTGLYLLFPFLPVFYVALSGPQVAQLAPRCRLRIATAGVWHNLILAGLAWMLWEQGLGLASRCMVATGWQDVSGQGVIVSGIQKSSPLHGLLQKGDQVTHLDDFPLDTSTFERPPSDPWSRYLLLRSGAGDARYDSMGWCVPSEWIATLPSDCCSESSDHASLCFASDTATAVPASGCPTTDLAGAMMQTRPRCIDSRSCVDSSAICIRPHQSAQLIRLSVEEHGLESKIVLFQGSRPSLHQQVRVTSLRPKALMPLGFAPFIEDSLSLIISICLALAFMNLLPLSMLDGSIIVEALLSCVLGLEPPSTDDDAHHLDSFGHARPGHGRKVQLSFDPLGLFIMLTRRALRPGRNEDAAVSYQRFRDRLRQVERAFWLRELGAPYEPQDARAPSSHNITGQVSENLRDARLSSIERDDYFLVT